MPEPRWQGGANIPVFGESVNPISTGGADYAHQSNTRPPQIVRPSDIPVDRYITGQSHYGVIPVNFSEMHRM